MRRNDREKDETFGLAVLRDCAYATLATRNPDGTPYCIPFSPVCVQRHLYFHCATEGQKLSNIACCGAVCVSAVSYEKQVPAEYTTAYDSVVATGSCTFVTDAAEKAMALRLLCAKYAPENPEGVETALARSLHRTAVCKIDLLTITGKSSRPPEKNAETARVAPPQTD